MANNASFSNKYFFSIYIPVLLSKSPQDGAENIPKKQKIDRRLIYHMTGALTMTRRIYGYIRAGSLHGTAETNIRL